MGSGAPLSYVPSSPVPTPGARTPARRRRIDWQHGARLLAEGAAVDDVAAALGISGEQVWRHLETSRLFRRQLQRQSRLQERRAP